MLLVERLFFVRFPTFVSSSSSSVQLRTGKLQALGSLSLSLSLIPSLKLKTSFLNTVAHFRHLSAYPLSAIQTNFFFSIAAPPWILGWDVKLKDRHERRISSLLLLLYTHLHLIVYHSCLLDEPREEVGVKRQKVGGKDNKERHTVKVKKRLIVKKT